MAQSPPSAADTLGAMSWEQKVNFVQWVTFFPALTLMVFMRRKVGFRVVKPTYLFSMAALLLLLAYFAGNMGTPFFPQTLNNDGTPNFASNGILLTIFALAMLAAGLVHRFMRRRDLNKPGVRWHTRTTGISHFSFLSLDTYVVNRFIDPLVCFTAGAAVAFISHPLGLWLIFAASCWGMHEQITYDKALDQQLDMLDGIVDSEVQAEVAEHFRGSGAGSATVKPLSMEDTAGIPTGLAPDITRQIALRQARTRAVSSAPPASAAAYSPAPAPTYTTPVEAAPTVTPDLTSPGDGVSSSQSPFATVVPEAVPADPQPWIPPAEVTTESADEPSVRRAPDNLA